MSKIAFILRKPNSVGECPVSIRHTHAKLSPFVITTGVAVALQHFDMITGKVSNKVPGYLDKNAKIERVRQDVDTARANIIRYESELTGEALKREYEAVIAARESLNENYKKIKIKYTSNLEQLRGELAELLIQVAEKQKRIKEYELDLGDFSKRLLITYIKDYPTLKELRQGTAAVYYSLIEQIKAFKADLTINEVNTDIMDAIEKYFIKNKLSNSTIKNYMVCVKAVLYAYEDKAGLDPSVINRIRTRKSLTQPLSEKSPLWLTKAELSDIEAVDLTGKLNHVKARDLFMFMVETGLRISDAKLVNKNHLKGNEIVLRTVKTDTLVNIPITPKAKAILEKYSNKMPTIPNTHFNQMIKRVAQLAGLNNEEITYSKSGSKTTDTLKKKWELISAHVARKTFITTALV